MAELYIKGYLCNDYNHNIGVTDDDPKECYGYTYANGSIIDEIENFAMDNGLFGRHRKGLGGRQAYIEDCNLRAYFTDGECNLEEAMLSMDVLMYGGDIKTKVNLTGYSEYTITGLDVEEFSIGGHDLDSELRDHMGEYIHLIIEC